MIKLHSVTGSGQVTLFCSVSCVTVFKESITDHYTPKPNCLQHPTFSWFFSFLSILLTGDTEGNKIAHFSIFNFFNSCHFRVDCKIALVTEDSTQCTSTMYIFNLYIPNLHVKCSILLGGQISCTAICIFHNIYEAYLGCPSSAIYSHSNRYGSKEWNLRTFEVYLSSIVLQPTVGRDPSVLWHQVANVIFECSSIQFSSWGHI